MPYFEPSRPIPDSLTPPNGATSVEMMPVLMPTMPGLLPPAPPPPPPDAPEVAGGERRRQAELGVVGELHRLVFGLEAEQRRDGAEGLLAGHLHVGGDAHQDGRTVGPAAAGQAQ